MRWARRTGSLSASPLLLHGGQMNRRDGSAAAAWPLGMRARQQEVPMRTIVEDRHLPVDINAQPVVQAAAALKPTLRYYQDDIEREQRLSPELVEQMHAAGFYR